MLLDLDLVLFLFHLFGFKMCYSIARIYSASLIVSFLWIVLTSICLPDSGCQGKSHLLSSQSGRPHFKLRSRKSCSMGGCCMSPGRKHYISPYCSLLFSVYFSVYFCVISVFLVTPKVDGRLFWQCCFS